MAKYSRYVLLALLAGCGGHRPSAPPRGLIVEECIHVPTVVAFRPASAPDSMLQAHSRGQIVVRVERPVSQIPLDSAEVKLGRTRIAFGSGRGLVLDTLPLGRVQLEISAAGFVPAHAELPVRQGYIDTVLAWLTGPGLVVPCGLGSTR